MNASEFARHLGVSPTAVAKALASGRFDAVVRWETRGARKYAVITDVQGAVKLWLSRPGARAPALGESTTAQASATTPASADADLESIATSRRQFERYRAAREQLEYETEAGRLIDVAQAKRVFGKQIQEAKNAVLALGKHARGRLPHLTTDDVLVIEALAREALEGLAAGAIEKPE